MLEGVVVLLLPDPVCQRTGGRGESSKVRCPLKLSELDVEKGKESDFETLPLLPSADGRTSSAHAGLMARFDARLHIGLERPEIGHDLLHLRNGLQLIRGHRGKNLRKGLILSREAFHKQFTV